MAPVESVRSQCAERECSEDDLYSEETALAECSAASSKRVRQPEDEKEISFRGVKLDQGIGCALDDYLLEKVIVRLPFKSFFQAASLSKSWRLRFCSDSFQNEVQSLAAASWKAYAPLYVNDKMDLVGYESSSQRWHVLPNHSYLQPGMVEDWLRAGAGSLLCWTDAELVTFGRRYSTSKVYHVNVTNPLTRSWRQLPIRPNMHFPDLVHVVCEGTEAYKVIVVTLGLHFCVQIFGSTNGSWTLDCYDSRSYDSDCGIAFKDGVLYMIVLTTLRRSGHRLVSFDVEKRIWTNSFLTYKVMPGDHQSHEHMMVYDVRFSKSFVCGSNVMLVVAHRDKLSMMEFDFDDDFDQNQRVLEAISVFELDLDHGLAVEVSRAPNEMVDVADVCSAAGHGDYIYIVGSLPSCPSIVYNVETQEWNWVNSATDRLRTSFTDTDMNQWFATSATYQPGLNPFLEV